MFISARPFIQIFTGQESGIFSMPISYLQNSFPLMINIIAMCSFHAVDIILSQSCNYYCYLAGEEPPGSAGSLAMQHVDIAVGRPVAALGLTLTPEQVRR